MVAFRAYRYVVERSVFRVLIEDQWTCKQTGLTGQRFYPCTMARTSRMYKVWLYDHRRVLDLQAVPMCA